MLTRINTTTPGSNGSPGGTPNSSQLGYRSSWYENAADSDSSPNEDEPTDDGEVTQEWGLSEGMELFEVSSKDNTGESRDLCLISIAQRINIPFYFLGIEELFDSLISAIVLRKDELERQNELTKRESIFLSRPTWAAQADEEEAKLSAHNYWTCCST